MEVTEEVSNVGLFEINPRKRKWSEVEETTLIECVVEREGDLFGDTKGIGIKKKSAVRRESWEDMRLHGLVSIQIQQNVLLFSQEYI